MKIKIFIILALVSIIVTLNSCKKYLDKKPQQSLYIPTTLQDLQALLDNNGVMNSNGMSLSELVSDNYYVTPDNFAQYDPNPTSTYTWDNFAYNDEWDFAYTNPVYYSNIVLDKLPTINYAVKDSAEFNNIKGAALFYRAYSFWQLAQVYCKPYSSSASNDPGIILRLIAPITAQVSRASVQQTYDQIISDMKQSSNLLSDTNVFPGMRPTKTAAYGALAKIYLSMRDYQNAFLYSNLYLQQDDSLIDYNNLNPGSTVPFQIMAVPNPERLFYEQGYPEALLSRTVGIIDSTLYNSYDDNDLRKTCFFRFSGGQWHFKGSYAAGPASVFTGIATDEMYLIRAECSARAGNTDAAINDLNTLMINRWKNNGTWVPFTATDATDALDKILIERRKELVYRGPRWSDLRRFNLEGANITLTRVINGTTYTLPPNDPRWVLLIPLEEVNRSDIAQNPR